MDRIARDMKPIIRVSQDDIYVEFAILLQNLNIQDGMILVNILISLKKMNRMIFLQMNNCLRLHALLKRIKSRKRRWEDQDLHSYFSKQESITSLGKTIAILESSDVMQGDWDSGTEQLIVGLRKTKWTS